MVDDKGAKRKAKQFIELVVLEQFFARFLTGTPELVQCNRPASLDEAMQLGDYLVTFPDLGVLGLAYTVSRLPSYHLKPEARKPFPTSSPASLTYPQATYFLSRSRENISCPPELGQSSGK